MIVGKQFFRTSTGMIHVGNNGYSFLCGSKVSSRAEPLGRKLEKRPNWWLRASQGKLCQRCYWKHVEVVTPPEYWEVIQDD